ncbi:MAG TPA: plastocyanin/azurin family copper-binding protein [Lentimicrobium sp.]|nr:plastocyanin/azurin family copper-binding protein [Lentimicrobium sp.]
MKRTLPILLTTLLTLFVLISGATIVTVTQQDNTFSPKDIEVKVGDTVRWVWTSGAHTTTSAEIPAGAAAWDSPLTTNVQQFDYVVTVEGTYNYVCTPHIDLGMVGTITATTQLGIGENALANSVKIYPNPARENAVMTLISEKPGQGILSMYDLLGNKVNKSDVLIKQGTNNINLLLETLRPGVYFIELKYNNEAAIVRRLVKSN